MSAARAPVDVVALRALVGGSIVTGLEVVDVTSSTNADLAARARAGAPEGTMLSAEFQRGGRGRFDRAWTSPRGAGLTFSIVLRPGVPVARWGWLPLLTGVALRAAVRPFVPGAELALKWPNDLQLGPRGLKAAGILAEAGEGWVVVGVGLNVDTRAEELPPDQAASLRMFADRPVDRTAVLGAFVVAFSSWYRTWVEAAADPDRSGLRAAYESACGTLGRHVEVLHPDHTDAGRAVSIDAAGALVIDTGSGALTVSAGDVVHVRPRDR